MTAKVRGRPAAAAALAGAAVVLSACGGTRASAAGATVRPTATPGSPAAGTAACPASALTATMGATGAAAGTRYVAIDFEHSPGSGTCLMDGYPTVSFVTGPHGSRLGPAAAPDASQGGPVRVRLASGGTAHAWLEVPTAQDYPASACHQVTAHWLRIVPPAGSAPLYVRYTAPVCSVAKSGFALAVMPARSGAGVTGHTP